MVHASNPELFETHLSLAAAQARQGKLAEATASYRNAISLNPNYSNAHNELGCLLERQGRLDEAYASFQAAIAVDPNHVNAHNNLAMLLGHQGKLDEACASLQVALALNPNHSEAHFNLGNVLLQQGKLDEASISFRRAIALSPNHVNAHKNLAMLLERQGKLDEASASFQTAIALNPNDSGAHSNLAEALVKQGRVEDAIASCRRALAIRPEEAKTHEILGFAFQCKGELKEAATCYRKAIELGSTNPMTSHLLAAVNGEDAGPTPPAIVTSLFDDYASRFDAHLVGELGYSIPRLMREAVGRLIPDDRRFQHALDLGCGTGLIGAHFSDVVAEIDGVDLSPKMLDQARSKQIYRKLDCEEIVAWLERSARESLCFDIVFSADVFIYVGNLEPAFKAIRRILKEGGLFVFSVERLAQGSFELLPTCRYAHSASYVRELAFRHGFIVSVSEQVDLRKEKNALIGGTVFVLTRS
jgi:predicted TPR repeat methyltransferase